MIIKKRKKPLVIQKLETAIPRLSPQYPQMPELQGELSRRYKGYIGEQKVDRHLEPLAGNYTILQDVCLQVEGKEFQIDGILITPHAIYLIEMKNYSGKIIFNTHLNQFTRCDGKVETGFNHPIAQAEFHQLQLTKWLLARNLQHIPVYYFIAISDPGTIIKVIGDEETIGRVVTHASFLPKKILAKEEALQSGGGQTHLNHAKIGQHILRACRLFDYDILGKYQIEHAHIHTGVHCPGCREIGMERVYNNWKCNKCANRFRFAHRRALSDYFLLIKPTITNSECMRWLRMYSKNTATKLLKEANLLYDSKRRRWSIN